MRKLQSEEETEGGGQVKWLSQAHITQTRAGSQVLVALHPTYDHTRGLRAHALGPKILSPNSTTRWLCNFGKCLDLSEEFPGGSDGKVSVPTMRETWVRSLGQKDPLKKEMATHSSTLAWKIPWTEEHGRLQFTGSRRVGHDWATSLHLTSQSFHLSNGEIASLSSAGCCYSIKRNNI